MAITQPKIVALAGGVGGAKLAHGLAQLLPPENLTVIVNTGDDFEHLGLVICPDLDTVCYTLAGLANPVTGWGLAGESWNAISQVIKLGGPGWFNLGDGDIGTHLERTRRLKNGESLSDVTRAFCHAWGVQPRVIPMTDDQVPTWVETESDGWLPFQEYFVHRKCQPVVTGFKFDGAQSAAPAPGAIEAIEEADAIILCPSNPWVSIGPILAISPYLQMLKRKKVVAVSPIVGGAALKGPAAKMYKELGITPSALAVAEQYHEFLSGFVMDELDRDLQPAVEQLKLRCLVIDTVMKDEAGRARLAQNVLKFVGGLETK